VASGGGGDGLDRPMSNMVSCRVILKSFGSNAAKTHINIQCPFTMTNEGQIVTTRLSSVDHLAGGLWRRGVRGFFGFEAL
jgi:hypothetical protein